LRVKPRRLGKLVDALILEGVLTRELSPAKNPPRAPVPDEGWGRLAEVIRRDRPLDAAEHSDAFHAHLLQAGEAPARALAERLIEWAVPKTLLDLGGGLGAYARAFVERGGEAVVIDRPEVIARATPGERLRFVAGDIFDVAPGDFGVVLLCNVLHLYGPSDCARLCARGRESGGVVVVKDLDPATPAGTWFALNMALYTDAGDVHDSAEIQKWLGGGEVTRLGDHLIVRT
jgi:hypothetical protein